MTPVRGIILKHPFWRADREAEGARLLSEYGPKAHLGFESPALRHFNFMYLCLNLPQTQTEIFLSNHTALLFTVLLLPTVPQHHSFPKSHFREAADVLPTSPTGIDSNFFRENTCILQTGLSYC